MQPESLVSRLRAIDRERYRLFLPLLYLYMDGWSEENDWNGLRKSLRCQMETSARLMSNAQLELRKPAEMA
jgi:hypothetical protein